MRRKVLQDHANVFCQMFLGWRTFNDLEQLTALGPCSLDIDILKGSCRTQSGKLVDLYMPGELQLWFLKRLKAHRIPVSSIKQARLIVKITHRAEPKYPGVLMDFNCSSLIETDEHAYHAALHESWG